HRAWVARQVLHADRRAGRRSSGDAAYGRDEVGTDPKNARRDVVRFVPLAEDVGAVGFGQDVVGACRCRRGNRYWRSSCSRRAAGDAPRARAGTARDPIAISAASSVVLVERKKRVVEAPAGLDAERFAVVSEIEIVPPAAAQAGAVSDETRRSGPMRIAMARVL